MWVKPVFNGWDMVGTLISKFGEKFWDIDIEKITVSHCHHIACNEDDSARIQNRLSIDQAQL